MLLAINDFQNTIGLPSSYIPRVQPAVCIHHLIRLLLVVVIAFEDVVAFEADLEEGGGGGGGGGEGRSLKAGGME